MDSSQFYGIASIAYILAMVAYIAYLVFRNPSVGVIATTITVAGFLSHTAAFFFRWKEFYDMTQMGILRAIPLTNLYESLIFFVWCLILGYLIIEWKYKSRSFGAFITPIAGMALAFIDISGMDKSIHPLVPGPSEQLASGACNHEFYLICSLCYLFCTVNDVSDNYS